MVEIKTFTSDEVTENDRARLMLLVCDESTIKCASLRELQNLISSSRFNAVLVLPDNQYRKGLRGFAKAQILASVSPKIEGVMPLNLEKFSVERTRKWAAVQIHGPISWTESLVITPEEARKVNLKINETSNPFDRLIIQRANDVRMGSNCWLDPAGCVIVKNGRVLMEKFSTRFNENECKAIPLVFQELSLKSGERMMFCDSLHAERVAITEAAKWGVSLKGSTMYVTKFPCRPCVLSSISAGINTIVFEKDSYGLLETADLLNSNNIELKRVIS